MKSELFGLFVLVSVSTSILAAPTQKEVIAMLNRVQARVASGDLKAMDELTTLPGDWAAPALLHIFKHNYQIAGATPTNKAAGLKAAQLATTVAGGEEYLVKLLEDKPAREAEAVAPEQEAGIRMLVAAKNHAAVRILCGALDQPQMSKKVVRALNQLSLPGAPQFPPDRMKNADLEVIAKWKEWWAANKETYNAKGTSSAPIP